jgi:hypothetical protein
MTCPSISINRLSCTKRHAISQSCLSSCGLRVDTVFGGMMSSTRPYKRVVLQDDHICTDTVSAVVQELSMGPHWSHQSFRYLSRPAEPCRWITSIRCSGQVLRQAYKTGCVHLLLQPLRTRAACYIMANRRYVLATVVYIIEHVFAGLQSLSCEQRTICS